MPLRPEERAAIDDLLAFLARQRNTTFDGAEGADPPDWVAVDRTTKAVIAIEHTRIEPQDRESLDRWEQLRRVVQTRAQGVVPGVYLFGQARLDQRFPTMKKVDLDPIAQRIVDGVTRRRWSAPGETWEVSPTAAPLPLFHVKITYVSQSGSEMVGIPPLARRPLWEIIESFQETVERKARDLHAKAAHADEHLLLVDAIAVHPPGLGTYEGYLIDVMEILRTSSHPVPTAVYFRQKDIAGNIEIRRVWPS